MYEIETLITTSIFKFEFKINVSGLIEGMNEIVTPILTSNGWILLSLTFFRLFLSHSLFT